MWTLVGCVTPATNDTKSESDEPAWGETETDWWEDSGRVHSGFTWTTPDCAFEAEGGDLEGTWRFTPSECRSGRLVPIIGGFCDEFRYTGWQEWNGTLTLEPGGRYVLDVVRWTQTSVYVIPAHCNPEGCDALAAYLEGECVDDQGGCTCTIAFEVPEPENRTGDWWVESYGTGPRLFLGDRAGLSAWLWGEYDVEGGELRVRDRLDNVTKLVR